MVFGVDQWAPWPIILDILAPFFLLLLLFIVHRFLY